MTYSVRSASNTNIQAGVHDALYMVVRQPLLDLHSRVHAYQLLFRGGTKRSRDGKSVIGTFAETAAHFALQKPSELKKLTGKMTAFVSWPFEGLSDQLAQNLPSTLTVLQIPADTQTSPELLEMCQQLKTLGFRFALNNFDDRSQVEQLVDLTDYVMMDFSQTSVEKRRHLIQQLRDKTVGRVATNIETHADHLKAREEGFTLFKGYYFCEPVPMRNRRPPANQLLRIDILRALQQAPLEVHKVSPLVKRDGPLTYQLLRLANSPLWAVRKEIDTIEQALLTVGDDTFRRIATMAIANEFNGNQPQELLCLAMVRARFCEVAGSNLNLDPFSQYLLGLFSLLPAMQGQAMREIAPALPLGDEIREALLATKNRERALLGWLEHFERGDWNECDAAAESDGLNQQALAETYVEAVAWTEEALHSVS